MKRREPEETSSCSDINPSKKTKQTTNSQDSQCKSFDDGIVATILKYLDSMNVIKKCFLLSKQWYRLAITEYKFALEFDKEMWGKFVELMFSDHENVDQQTFLCTYRKNIIGLDFGNTSLSYRDACLIAKFESLEELIGEVGDEMEALVDYLPNLKSLDVGLVQEICYENVEYISELQNLTTFSIRYSNIGRKHLQIIGEMSELTDLNISGNPINSLLPIRSLTRITSLSAADCSFLGDDGIYK